MKRLIKLLNFGLLAVMTWGMAACTNELSAPNNGKNPFQNGSPVVSPDLIVWSGNETLINTFNGTRNAVGGDIYTNSYAAATPNSTSKTRAEGVDVINGVETGEWKWNDETNRAVGWVTVKTDAIDRKADQELIDEKLPEKGQNVEELPYVDFDFLFYAKDKDLTFEMYPVYSQTSNKSNFGIFWYDESGQKQELEFYDNFKDKFSLTQTDWSVDGGKEYSNGIKITIKKGYKFGFFWGGNRKYAGEYWDPDEATTCYSQSSLNKESLKTDGGGIVLPERTTTNVRAGIFVEGDRMYLGLEDWTDFDYQDWVFSFDQILPTVDGDNPDFDKGDDTPNPPTPGKPCPNDEKCEHPESDHNPDGSCNKCPDNEDCNECPNVSEQEGSGCTHPRKDHTYHPETDTWTCDDCEASHEHSDCNPCPEEFGKDCGHAGDIHREDGTCPECEKEEVNGPCKKEEGGGITTPDPCPNDGKCDHPESDHNPDGTCKECPENEGCNGCPATFHPEHEKCQHPADHHNPDGSCRDCEEGQPCYKEPRQPGNGTLTPTGNEVEINFSLNDVHTLPDGRKKYDIADLVTKLSIHVRYPHDVEVIIPVPERFYCDQDDLYILKDHYTDADGTEHWEYGGEVITYDAFVADAIVTLGVEFVTSANDYLTTDGGGYIRVWTNGINQDVIDELQENFGDGINFEVYNYFNRGTQYTTGSYPEISYEELQYKYLSHTMVNFDWNETATRVFPDFYINAFNQVNNEPVKGDCYVWILGDDHANNGVYKDGEPIIRDLDTLPLGAPGRTTVNFGDNSDAETYFTDPYQGEHYNGSPLNWIYTNRELPGAIDSNDMPAANWPFGSPNRQYYLFDGNPKWQFPESAYQFKE